MVKGIGLGLAALSSVLLMACGQGVKFSLPETTDNFNQSIAYNNKVDILWIMDNSSSMQNHQQNLSKQVPAMVAKLQSLKMDFQMAVVTSSMGGTNPNGGHFMGSPKIMTNSTPNLAATLASRLVVGEDGSNLTRGLYSMETVLSPSYLANEGRGFLRKDALLVVVALSDDDDKSQSAGPTTAIPYYTQFLDSVRSAWSDGSRAWLFNYVGILSNTSTCGVSSGNFNYAGLTFMGLADASGGTKSSLCSDLSLAVSGISARIVQVLTDFKLSKKPLESSIVVTINGVIIPRNNVNGWDYLADKNIIRFYGSAVPAADASIKVDFKPAEAN